MEIHTVFLGRNKNSSAVGWSKKRANKKCVRSVASSCGLSSLTTLFDCVDRDGH